MARNKNALRKHYIQEYNAGETEPSSEGEWLQLAKYISDIEVEPNEETEEEGFYDGDGTPEETVISVARAYSPEGYFDPSDPAQKYIDSIKDTVGDARKVWHKVVSSNGELETVGRASVLNIVTDGGEATGYETFSCTIRFDEKPEVTEVVPEG